jgi:UDP-N-acetyl-D-galactosamine dehydrogenase
MISNKRIAVIGLGYVGLPLARLFATKYPVVGFDINQSRINGLLSGTDSTLEISDEVLQAVLLDKTHVTMIAFPKFKKKNNE